MSPLLAFVVGYIAGAKTGPQTFEELRKIWEVLAASDEFRGIATAMMGSLQSVLQETSATAAPGTQPPAAAGAAGDNATAPADDSRDLAEAWVRLAHSREVETLLAGGSRILRAALVQGAASMTPRPPASSN